MRTSYFSNQYAIEYMKRVILETFSKDGKKMDKLKNIPMMTNTREIGNMTKPSNQLLLSRAGPSVNMKVIGSHSHLLFDCDFLLALPVAGWPIPAKEWTTRTRQWPKQELVDWLVSLPCHLIAKPIKEQDDTTWRFSFSQQELELAKTVPLEARNAYIALKHIFKKYLHTINSGLKSYHLLTLFLRFMESQGSSMWTMPSIPFSSKLTSLVRFVADHLQLDFIPHYFIRTINLVNIMPVDKQTNPLKCVASKLLKIAEKESWTNDFIFDKTAYDTIHLNRDLHKKVLRERNISPSRGSCKHTENSSPPKLTEGLPSYCAEQWI